MDVNGWSVKTNGGSKRRRRQEKATTTMAMTNAPPRTAKAISDTTAATQLPLLPNASSYKTSKTTRNSRVSGLAGARQQIRGRKATNGTTRSSSEAMATASAPGGGGGGGRRKAGTPSLSQVKERAKAAFAGRLATRIQQLGKRKHSHKPTTS
jgi:hypothetical protein